MARLTWSPQAAADLEAICSQISTGSEEYARVFAQDITALAEGLLDHPRIGRVVPEYQEDVLRERIYQNYRVVYELAGRDIEIVAIVHGARDFRAALNRT